MNINFPALIDGLIPLVGGLFAIIFASRKSSTDSEKKREARKKVLLPIAILLILFGIFQLKLKQDQIFSKPTPESVVAEIKKKIAFPLMVDEITRYDSIEAKEGRISFVVTITKSLVHPKGREALISDLESEVRKNACSQKQNIPIFNAGISVEFVYFMNSEKLASFVISKADCQ